MGIMTLEEVKSSIDLKTDNWQNIENNNCYAFALGLDIDQKDICECAYEIGMMSRYFRKIKGYISQIELLNLDFETLGLIYQECSIKEPLSEDEWKLVYLSNVLECGYHFLRETKNAGWYHKPGFGDIPTNLDTNGNIIKDPRQVVKDYRSICYNNKYMMKCYKLKRG